jgi:hypothetical protein
MSYIEKEKLIKADIASIENRVRHAFNQGYDLGFKDGKKRTKPQEQVSILDKIRAEIIERDKNIKSVRSDSCCFFTAEEVLEIIDKYKIESEDKT